MRELLTRPWSEARAILLDESDEGQRLRRWNPFSGIVTEEERLAIIARHRAPGPLVPYDPSKVPNENMENILTKGVDGEGEKSLSSRRGNQR